MKVGEVTVSEALQVNDIVKMMLGGIMQAEIR